MCADSGANQSTGHGIDSWSTDLLQCGKQHSLFTRVSYLFPQFPASCPGVPSASRLTVSLLPPPASEDSSFTSCDGKEPLSASTLAQMLSWGSCKNTTWETSGRRWLSTSADSSFWLVSLPVKCWRKKSKLSGSRGWNRGRFVTLIKVWFIV